MIWFKINVWGVFLKCSLNLYFLKISNAFYFENVGNCFMSGRVKRPFRILYEKKLYSSTFFNIFDNVLAYYISFGFPSFSLRTVIIKPRKETML